MNHEQALPSPNAADADVSLSERTLDLLQGDQQFTDLHIESGQVAMIRLASGNWTEALDRKGQPFVVPHERVIEFLNGVFLGADASESDTGRVAAMKAATEGWKRQLHVRGSLHPAVNLSRPDGDGMVSFRLRCTVQKQLMGEAIGLVIRPLRRIPESLQQLGLPVQVSGMLKSAQRGLIVVTGPTGSGKSTTLAAMVNEINVSKRANILTIEDPVEFVHERKRSIINQRELGIDVGSYQEGVHVALRFVTDVILIGEIRDAETMEAALRAAESGHLVLTTTHAPTTVDAIRKMIAFLANQGDVQSLAACLVGVVAQALVPDAKEPGAGNHLAFEWLNCRDSRVSDVVAASAGDSTGQKVAQLEHQVRSGEMNGVATPMIQSLGALLKVGKIETKAALSVAAHPADREALAKLYGEAGARGPASETFGAADTGRSWTRGSK